MNVRGNWSERAEIVARWFGVDRRIAQLAHKSDASSSPAPPSLLKLGGGQLILLTGASGAGKSTLLQCVARQYRRGVASWIDLHAVGLPHRLVIDAMADAMGGDGADDNDVQIVAALEALSRVGLGEVWTYLRTPAQLSEGQRWRLRLALALARGAAGKRGPQAGRLTGDSKLLTVLAADEFAAPLDRVTALVVARALRKAVSARSDLCAIVATSHGDLVPALDPDFIVQCDFGIVKVSERRSS